MTFGSRIRGARSIARLSLRALAEQIGVSAQMVSKYERDITTPDSSMLIKISTATEMPLDYFFRSNAVELTNPRYRKRKSLPKKEENRIHGQTTDWLERYLELEHLSGEKRAMHQPDYDRFPVRMMDDVELAADTLRDRWDLGLDPIENLVDVLEMHGIKVGLIETSPRFDALTFECSDGQPVIALNKRMSGDRQRFTLAHELGHIVLELSGDLDEELAGNRFAGAFLVPAEMARAELNGKRTRLDVYELYQLKHKYGMSMQAWCYRANDLGIIQDSQFVRLQKMFAVKKWRTQEPGEQVLPEHPTQMELLISRAVSERRISRRRAEELFGGPLPTIPTIPGATGHRTGTR